MWHRRGWFGGGWIFWIFIFLIFSGFMGKAGFPGSVIPWVVIWLAVAAFSGGKRDRLRSRRSYDRPEPAHPPQQSRQAAAPVQKPAPSVVAAVTRSLAGLPSRCKSCGGPVDETTVNWRGSRPVCGFCGTGLVNRPQDA